MSDFTPKNDVLNLSPKASKMSSFSKTEPHQKDNSPINSKNETESFLNSLLKAIEQTNEFLPDNMKISQKEIVNEAMNKLQKGSFNENDKISIFESASFMQILSMLELLKMSSSDVKFGNLSNKLTQLVKTETNFNALKGAKNLSELLEIAKDLGLNVKNIKIDRLLDLKATFPNLDKADFFKGAVDSVFKEVINNKIAHINKNLSYLASQNPTPTKTNTKNNQNPTSLLSKTLQNLDFILSDKQIKSPKKENINSSENKISLVKERIKNSKHNENLKETKELKLQSKETQSKEKVNLDLSVKEKPDLKSQNPLSEKEIQKEDKNFKSIKHGQTQDKSLKNSLFDTKKLEPNKTKIEDKIPALKNELPLDKNSLMKSHEGLKELPKESLKDEKKLNASEKKHRFENIKNSTPNTNTQTLNIHKENIQQAKNSTPSIQNLKDSQNIPNTLNYNPNPVKEGTSKEIKEAKEVKNSGNKMNINVEQKANLEPSKMQNIKNNENFSNLPDKETNKEQERNTPTQKESHMEDLNPLIKDLARVNHNKSLAKETLQHFSQDLKEALTQYKAPVTKLSITLNPSNLGEVEVTLMQRGSNLHINFNSNTTAMNIFIQNQAEFKNSLVNMGFTGLEMNFSDQNKKEQNQSKNRSGYGFEDVLEGKSEGEKVNLELVLARYF